MKNQLEILKNAYKLTLYIYELVIRFWYIELIKKAYREDQTMIQEFDGKLKIDIKQNYMEMFE